MPAYAGDWLRASVARKGEAIYDSVEFHTYVTKSVEEKLPYFCEDEEEYDVVSSRGYGGSDCSPMRGEVAAICSMGTFYSEGMKHDSPEKKKYWSDIIIRKAQTGDREAQAILCTNSGSLLVGKEVMNRCKQQYEEKLRTDAANGDRYAQLAVGRFLTADDFERIEILAKAANKGLTDACYWYANYVPDMFLWRDENGNLIKDTSVSNFNHRRTWQDLSDSERGELGRLMFQAYWRGSDCANGIFTAECAFNVAEYYDPTEDHVVASVDKDKSIAIFWYQKAADAGMSLAKTHLEYLRNK